MKAIEVRNLKFGYGDRPIFEGISLSIESGEFFGIIGPNGSGKSTLLRLFAGIHSPQEGSVLLFEQEIKQLSRRKVAQITALVPQESFFAFEWRVEEVVMMGRNPYLGVLDRPSQKDISKVEEAMRLAEVIEFKDRGINSLSAGEKQRVVLARALAQEPSILLLDEATSHLDINHRLKILRILKDLNRMGRTIIFVSHELNEAALYCSRILLLSPGRSLACDLPEKVITEDMIEKAYGIRPIVFLNPLTKNRPQVLLPPE